MNEVTLTTQAHAAIPELIEEEQAMLLSAFPFTNDEETGEAGTGPVNRRLAFEYSQQATSYQAEAMMRFAQLVKHYISVGDKA